MSDREGRELNEAERRYEDGSEPALLDVVEIGVTEQRPAEHQPENWIVDSSHTWRRVARVTLEDIAGHIDNPATLWANGSQSTDFTNNRVHGDDKVNRSLYLIRVDDLVIDVFDSTFGVARRVRGEFSIAGTQYRLAITDPVIEAQHRSRLGRHDVGRACLTVSLGELYEDGYCYKLAAAVMPDPKE